MMMQQMMGGNTGTAPNGMANMMPMMMLMNGGDGNMFDGMLDGMFDFGSSDDAEPEVSEEEEDEE